MAIYMKWGENKIPGRVSLKGHEKWIELTSFSWGNSRAIMTTAGRVEDREASQPSISEAVVTKEFDIASVSLWKCSLAEEDAQDCTIDFVRTGGPTGEGVLAGQCILTNCMVSSYSLSSGGDLPLESLSLNATKWEWKYHPSKIKGEAGNPVIGSYDLKDSTIA